MAFSWKVDIFSILLSVFYNLVFKNNLDMEAIQKFKFAASVITRLTLYLMLQGPFVKNFEFLNSITKF